jgi:Icc-related predicted phosphoesterase
MEYRKENFGHGGIYAGFKVFRDKSLSITDSLTGKKRPLLIAGISGSLKYNNGLNQYTDRQMKRRLIQMIPALIKNKLKYGRYLDILLTHASPRHIHDKEDPCHKGFECFNWFIKKFSPAYLIHGHIHLYDAREERRTRVQDTEVVNAYAHFIIEYP